MKKYVVASYDINLPDEPMTLEFVDAASELEAVKFVLKRDNWPFEGSSLDEVLGNLEEVGGPTIKALEVK